MLINVYSYKDAEKQIISNKNQDIRKNWISIQDLGFEHLYNVIDKYCKNVLVIKFDDVTDFNIYHQLLHPFYYKLQDKRELINFNDDMAKKIIGFANKVYDNNEILNIHCWAGKSRSQAIGHCLNQYYNLYIENNEEDFVENIENSNDNFIGNYDVIRIMEKNLYLR